MKTFVIYLNVNVNSKWQLGVVRTAHYVYIKWHCCPPPPSAIGCVPGCRSTSVPPKVDRTMKGYLPSGPMKGIRCSPPSKGNQLPHSEHLTLVFVLCLCVFVQFMFVRLSLCSTSCTQNFTGKGKGEGCFFLEQDVLCSCTGVCQLYLMYMQETNTDIVCGMRTAQLHDIQQQFL